MTLERTLSILKPDATAANITGLINAELEGVGLRIIAQKRMQFTKSQAEQFYAIHKDRPFFAGLVSFMISGPVVVQVLEGDDAVLKNREIMGATNPEQASTHTIRRKFATSIEANCVHGSDSLANAKIETAWFFADIEIVG